MKRVFTIVLAVTGINVFGQVSENFDKPDLSAGSLACWTSANNGTNGCERVAAQLNSTSLSADSHLSLDTSTPIGGSASLNIQDSSIAPGSGCVATATETVYSPALGADGNTISFDLHINDLILPVPFSYFNVTISCGSFSQQFDYTTADIGSTIPISTVISGSGGGGVITILFSTGTASYTSSASYSVDIDNFNTTAIPDPANSCIQVLPVRLVDFTVQNAGQQAIVKWTTSFEQNSKGFEIQRSQDARQWQSLGFVHSEKANSSARIDYVWHDDAPLAGISYYRLHQIDLDGSSQNSPIRSVIFSPDGNLKIFPNPATERVYIENTSGLLVTKLIDAKGHVLQTRSGDDADGIDVSRLATGIYYLHMVLADGTTKVQKLVKQ